MNKHSKTFNPTTFLILFLLIGLQCSQAQFRGLAKKAKSKIESKTKRQEASESSSSESNSNSGASISADNTLKLDWSQFSMTPAVTMSSLLNNTEVTPEGVITVDYYDATFIPTKKIDGTELDPFNKDFINVSVYKNDDLIQTFKYPGSQRKEQDKQLRYMSRNTNILYANEYGEGTYRLDFHAGESNFYSFEFEMKKKTNTDPYKSGDLWYAEGVWSDLAYLHNSKHGKAILGIYARHLEFTPDAENPKKTDLKVKLDYKLFKNGKLYAQNRDVIDTYVKKGTWRNIETTLDLVKFKNQNSDYYLKHQDWEDGSYTLEVSLNHENSPRSYSFDVKDKKIVLAPEQDRTKISDPSRLIEGWNNYFWIKKKAE
ncbi:hypothetical protein ACJRPK_11530 [Aquimarina sp. 2-A2]|uniref:hypothetical protein n=1 Tax=Aquimarina sp. 2-A2 TaxID=3382644 RepID=UPI00387F1B2E